MLDNLILSQNRAFEKIQIDTTSTLRRHSFNESLSGCNHTFGYNDNTDGGINKNKETLMTLMVKSSLATTATTLTTKTWC